LIINRYYCNAKLGLSQWHHPLQQPPPVAAAAPAPAAAAAATAAGGLFIAAATFTGARPGYVFKSGSKGLGYYQDSTPAGLASAAAAAAGAGAAAAAAAGPTVAADVAAGPAVYSSSAVSAAAAQEDRGPKKTKLEKIAEMQAARNAALSKSGRGRAKQGGDELDPMDPVSAGCFGGVLA
jgi:hypothetical protein